MCENITYIGHKQIQGKLKVLRSITEKSQSKPIDYSLKVKMSWQEIHLQQKL